MQVVSYLDVSGEILKWNAIGNYTDFLITMATCAKFKIIQSLCTFYI
ncbi:MAG: hypothetical protein JWR87_3546 [Segetibacter sp.]|nr:hypothetical protein [Segetibacter sp.]